jgi:hypothetical protein
MQRICQKKKNLCAKFYKQSGKAGEGEKYVAKTSPGRVKGLPLIPGLLEG